MNASPLPLVEKACGISIEDALPQVAARRVTHAEMSAFCALYRRMAICKLFMSGMPDGFFEHLSHSAWSFAHFLAGAPEDAKRTSLSEPFFDAVACGDWNAARSIARSSSSRWNSGEEYEEDFLYAWFLMSRFALGMSQPELGQMLSRYEYVLAGGEDDRLPVCQALLLANQTLFDESLDRLIRQRLAETRARTREGRMAPDDAPTVAKLWVELMALLRFAEEAGLKTREHYPLAPSVARRLDRARRTSPAAWQALPSYREL